MVLVAALALAACEGDAFSPAGGAGQAGAGGGIGGDGGGGASAGRDGGGGMGTAGAGETGGATGGQDPGGSGGADPGGGAGGDVGAGGAGEAGAGSGGDAGNGDAGNGDAGEAGEGGGAGAAGVSAGAGGKGGGTAGTSSGAAGAPPACTTGQTKTCTLHGCATAGTSKCAAGAFGPCVADADDTCGGTKDIDCNGVPGDAPSCTKLLHVKCRGGVGGPGCNGDNDCFVTTNTLEGGAEYTVLTSFRLLTSPVPGRSLAMRRCRQNGTNIHRTVLAKGTTAECASDYDFVAEGPVVGHLLPPTSSAPAAGYRKIFGGGGTGVVGAAIGNYWLMTENVCSKTCDCTVAGNDHVLVAWAPPGL